MEPAAKKLCVRETAEPQRPCPALPATAEKEESQIEPIEGSCSSMSQEVEVRRLKEIILSNVLTAMESSSSESDDGEEEYCIYQRLSNNEPFPCELLLLSARKRRNAIANYIEETVPSYSENEFRMHFRISKSLFENLCGRLSNWETYANLRTDKRLSEKVHMLVFLWFAGHEACSFRDLADRFNLSRWMIHTIIHRISMFLSSISPETIKWPTQLKMEESSKYFDKKCLFSKAIGCIDATHVVIDPPAKIKDEYIDRKGNTTICMQAICDENKKFINIFVGYPGSCHDSWVLQNSPIYNKLQSYCGDYYLLGDSAYPCSKNLVTPYRDTGHLTQAQKAFNVKLSSGRVAIEHTFGILKQRFRQLCYCKLSGMKKLCHFIRACCVLHNIANEEDLEFTSEPTTIINDELVVHGKVSRGNCVRDPICQNIQQRQSALQ